LRCTIATRPPVLVDLHPLDRVRHPRPSLRSRQRGPPFCTTISPDCSKNMCPKRQREQRVAQMLVVAEPALGAADRVARDWSRIGEVDVLREVTVTDSSAPLGSTCQP
jgi:hypothetical protein